MYTPFDLSGRGAVVTGGNGGIGLGMARALLAAGAKVAIWGSNRDKTERARAQLAAECGDAARVHAFVCDVGDETQVEVAFTASAMALGRVDACFANAGVSSKGSLMTEMTLDEFRRVQRVNVEGVFLTFRAAARHMAAHGQGGTGGHRQHRGHRGRGAQQPLRGVEGRGHGLCACAGGGTGAAQDPRQLDPARLDRHRDDRAGGGQPEVRRRGAATHSRPPLGQHR